MQKNYKLLIIDDSPEVLITINDLLLNSKYNYEILNATNGSRAIEILEQEMPDLILSDWDMPETNGLQLTTYIQSCEEYKHIPIIICSGVMVETQNIIEALGSGAIDFLRKPFNELELIARINSKLLFIETLNKLKEEKQLRINVEKTALQEKLDIQNAELTSKALMLGKYNDLLKFIVSQLAIISDKIKTETEDEAVKSLVSQITMNMNKDTWEEFLNYFNSIHPLFVKKLLELHPNLSVNEVKLCVLLRFNLTTKQISSITQQTVRSIEMARHRLRQKLDIDKDENLIVHFNSI